MSWPKQPGKGPEESHEHTRLERANELTQSMTAVPGGRWVKYFSLQLYHDTTMQT